MSKPNPTSVAVPLGASVDDAKTFKQGHSFLGCLCDMRRAVIMLNILGIGIGIAVLLAVILVDKYGENIEDGDLKYTIDSYSFGAMVGIQLGVIIAHLSGILGAINFAVCPILIAILMDVAFAVLSGLGNNWIGLGGLHFRALPSHRAVL
jgi:hypothetical protein